MSDVADREPRATSIDAHVGSRIRLRRTLLGMSQERLGDALGVTFQQVQKYERGVNRVGASRLYDLSRVFGVPVGFFYDDMPQAEGAFPSGPVQGQRSGFADALDGFGDDTSNRREIQDLLRAYNRIADPARRRQAIEMVRALAPAE